jgi:hypothetical protein
MAVLYTQHFAQFFDDNGDPLASGKLYTYAAGTTTPKATYTTAAGAVENTNPVILDSAGRAVIFLSGSYKFTLTDSLDNVIKTTDNVTAFTATGASSTAYFESFSGDGSDTTFTTSTDLGTDEKAIWVLVDDGLGSYISNGTFATDTVWTKGSGWTIGSGVATASGAISTAISQTATTTVVQGQSYTVTYTITRSAGGLIPSIGGTSGTERTSSGTYTETIIAGSTQTIAFTGNGFTGTLDGVTVTKVAGAGFQLLPPTSYTINGTSLTLNTAPKTGTNNIQVWSPSTLVNAASASAAAADASATAAAASATLSATAAGYSYTYDTDTTASDPGAGYIRFNNATLSSATAFYVSETTGDSQSISGDLATWDDSTSTVRGKLRVFKQTNPAIFALFNITGTITDNGTWDTFTVAYITGSGSLADNDEVTIEFLRNGDKGDTGAAGGPLADGDYGDVTVSSSGTVITIDNSAVTEAKLGLSDNTTNNSSTSKHGLMPKLSNSATLYFDSLGTQTNPALNAVLTGYTSGAGTVAATDTILQAIQKLNGNASAGAAGLTQIATSTPTAVATVDFTSIPTTYRGLVLYWNEISCDTTTRSFQITTNAGAGLGSQLHVFTQIAGATPTSPGAGVPVWTAATQTNAQVSWGWLYFPAYQSGPIKAYHGLVSIAATSGDITTGTRIFVHGVLESAAVPATGAIQGLRAYWSGSGNFDTGTITLYGVN